MLLPRQPSGAPPQDDTLYGGWGPRIMAATWTMVPFAIVLVAGRLYLRLTQRRPEIQRKHQEWALWLALFALVTGIINSSFITVALHYGYGNFNVKPSVKQAAKSDFNQNIGLVFVMLSVSLAKASLAVFLVAMQGNMYRRGAWLLYFLAGSCVAINITFSFLDNFGCDPPEAAWDHSVKGDCRILTDIDLPFNIFQATWNGITDLILAIYPSFIIHKLFVATRTKLLLGCLMGVGVLATAIAFLRVSLVVYLIDHSDSSDTVMKLVILTELEVWIVFLAVSLPPVWPLLKPYVHLTPKQLSLRKITVTGHEKHHANADANASVPFQGPHNPRLDDDNNTAPTLSYPAHVSHGMDSWRLSKGDNDEEKRLYESSTQGSRKGSHSSATGSTAL